MLFSLAPIFVGADIVGWAGFNIVIPSWGRDSNCFGSACVSTGRRTVCRGCSIGGGARGNFTSGSRYSANWARFAGRGDGRVPGISSDGRAVGRISHRAGRSWTGGSHATESINASCA